MNENKLLKMFRDLTNDQRDRLYDFFTVVSSWKNGTATELDFMRFITTLPEKDGEIFTQICNVIGSRE